MKKGIWWVIGIVVVVIIIISATRNSNTEIGPVKIGAVLPLSGDLASYAESSRNAAIMAIEESGMKDKVNFIIEDDHNCASADGVTAVSKLLNIDKVDALYGPVCSSEVLSVLPITDPKKILIITPAATSKTLTNAGKYMFRTIASDSVRANSLAEYVYSKGFKKAAFINDNSQDTMVQEVSDASDTFAKAGGQVVTKDTFNAKDTDFRTQLLKAKGAGVDVIFVASFYKQFNLIFKQAKNLGLHVQFAALDESVDTKEFFDVGGKDVNGVLVSATVVPTNEASKTFTERYKARFGNAPTMYTAEGYDAMTLLLRAIKAGGTSGDSIKENLLKIGNNYQGASGVITFESNGDVQKPAMIKIAKDGKFVDVQ